MTWGLVAVAGATLVGGTIAASSASSAANKAANAQVQGAEQSAQVQREGLAQQQQQFDQSRQDALSIYNTSRGDLAPYRDIGTNALLALSDQLGISRPSGMESRNVGNASFRQDPGYKFAFDQGLKAVDARFPGMSRSGAKAKALTDYGQGTADQQYGNWLQRIASLAGVGQTATGQSGTLGTNLTNTLTTIGGNNSSAIGNYSVNAGNTLENAAAARASGYVGGSNAVTGAIGSGINNLSALYGMGAFGNRSNSLSAATSAAIANNPLLF